MPIFAFLVATTMFFLLIYIISDTAQKFLYDQVVDGLWWRALLAAIPLAILIVLFPCRLDTMFTENPLGTLFQAVGWYLTLWLICQYQNVHALVLGLAGSALCSWMVTMAVDSILGTGAPTP
ncbi:MAG: hypothetical protein U1D30_13275 [Planctomycetota bacterium]